MRGSEADDENTSNRRSCAFTGMFKPVVIPLVIVPNETTPDSAGASVTNAPGTGEKTLFGVVDL